MAVGSWTVYSNAVLGAFKKLFDLSTETYVCVLVTNSYTPAPNTDTLWSSVSANELTTAGGYTAGGVVVASETMTLATATSTFTSASPAWTTFTAGPFRYAVIVRRASGSLAAGDLLLAYVDLTGSGSISGTGGTFTLTISGSGIFAATHSP